MRPTLPWQRYLFLAAATAWRYRACGHFVHGFVLGKLRHDPVYRELLEILDGGEDGRIVDLGCGQGIAMALLATAAVLGSSPGRRSPAPQLCGVECGPQAAAVARAALAGAAEIATGDVRAYRIPGCRAVLLIDLLYHLEPEAQLALLGQARAALEPGGLLILREADAGGGWRFALTWLAEWLRNLGRGRPWRRRYYRTLEAWRETLSGLGFAVDARPMSQGTPFANYLLVARLERIE